MGNRRSLKLQPDLVETGLRKLSQKWFRSLVEDVVQDKITVGIDEVGRGCVFGPVYVVGVAVVNDWRISGITDSKLITKEAVRRALASEIQHNTVWVATSVDAPKLNHLTDNWKVGTPKPMTQIIRQCGQSIIDSIVPNLMNYFPGRHIDIMFDGDDWEPSEHTGYSIKCEPKADLNHYEVSAASILAKVLRDNWVHDQVKLCPNLGRYDMDNCKGYGTEKHIQGLLEYGLTDHHRRSACETLINNYRDKHHA